MIESPRIEGLLRRIRREIRRRRAEYYGPRGAFWAAVGGVVILLAKHVVGSAAPWAAAGLVALGAAAGVALAAGPPVHRPAVPPVAGPAVGLHEPVATTL